MSYEENFKASRSFEENMDIKATEAKRETVGSQLLTLAVGVVKHAAMVAEETHIRLIDVSRESSPNAPEVAKDGEQWPPLFATLRTSLLQIDEQLNSIQRTIQRVEV